MRLPHRDDQETLREGVGELRDRDEWVLFTDTEENHGCDATTQRWGGLGKASEKWSVPGIRIEKHERHSGSQW